MAKMTHEEIRRSNTPEANRAAREIANNVVKSAITVDGTIDVNDLGRSYYCFCLEQALTSIKQARALVHGDITDRNHQLPTIERLIAEALHVS